MGIGFLMRINTNVQTQIARHNYERNGNAEQVAVRRLSSGDRIFKAALDPAGLAISEMQRSKVVGMYQNERNINDGISLLQVAEGTLSSLHAYAGRLRELAMQAANDTVTDGDRGLANLEFEQMKQEMLRLTKSAKYNGNLIVNDSGSVYEIQVGLNNKQGEDKIRYDLSKALAASNNFGLKTVNIKSKVGAQIALKPIDEMIQKVSEGRAGLGSTNNRFQSMINTLQVSRENLESSKSKVRDSDVAKQTAAKAAATLRKNATTSMLKQTSNNPSKMLKLLS